MDIKFTLQFEYISFVNKNVLFFSLGMKTKKSFIFIQQE